MAILQPISTDKLNSPDHSLSHRAFANDTAAPAKSIVIDSAGLVGIGTETPNSTLKVYGSFAGYYRAISALRTLDATDHIIDCTSGTFNVTLPTAVNITGRTYIIKNSGTGIITILTSSSQTIDGATTLVLGVRYESVTLVSDGANWIII